MRLNFYEDPGHGWLAVPLPLLDRLGLLDSISTYSYMRGMLAHLEEDCDYSLFWVAATREGMRFTIREHRTNARSRIRNYCQFNAGVARRWMAEAQLSAQLSQ
jgi:hypothetical protein